jgi:hypothetical protein
MLLTSLPPAVPAAAVLAAYRLRWQVEMVWSQMTNSLMFVVNAFRHDGAVSTELRR